MHKLLPGLSPTAIGSSIKGVHEFIKISPKDRSVAERGRMKETIPRRSALAPVRKVVDDLDSLVRIVRESYPERYPVPPEIDALLDFHVTSLETLRGGELRRFLEEGAYSDYCPLALVKPGSGLSCFDFVCCEKSSSTFEEQQE